MKKTTAKYFFSAVLFCFALSTSAQKIKVLNATSQNWAGGMAGHHGINYFITIQCKDTGIVPDTVWINHQYYPLSLSNPDSTLKRSHLKKNLVTYTISVGEFYNDLQHQASTINEAINSKKIPEKKFSGAALITFQQKGKQHFFIVKTFLKLPSLNYP